MSDLFDPRPHPVDPADPADRSVALPAPTDRRHRHRRDRGQATTLLLACVVFITLVAVGAGEFGARMIAHQRARAAADAAALAGTTAGRAGAQRLASANGARLVAFVEHGDEVTVTVEVRGERATARATDGP